MVQTEIRNRKYNQKNPLKTIQGKDVNQLMSSRVYRRARKQPEVKPQYRKVHKNQDYLIQMRTDFTAKYSEHSVHPANSDSDNGEFWGNVEEFEREKFHLIN
jgi:hypothetical protein